MRIAIVGPYPSDPAKITGGIESVVRNQINGLMNKNIDIDVITLNRNISKIKNLDFTNRIRIHYLPQSKYPNLISWKLFDKKLVLKKLKDVNPDVVHFHGANFIPADLGKSFKSILTVHGLLPEEQTIGRNFFSGGIRKIIHSHYFYKSLKICKIITTISQYVEEYIKPYTKSELYAINNPIQQKFFDINHNEKKKRLLFIGSISHRKSVHHLILAMKFIAKKYNDVELHIAGKISSTEYFESLKKIVKNNNLEKNIVFLGLISEEEKLKEYEKSSILILPSKEESAPVVISEAMAVGIPIVGSNKAGIPYMIDDGETGLIFEYGNTQMLAEKICVLLEDEKLRKKMGRKAKEAARQRWSADIIAKKTIDVYTEILSGEGKKF